MPHPHPCTTPTGLLTHKKSLNAQPNDNVLRGCGAHTSHSAKLRTYVLWTILAEQQPKEAEGPLHTRSPAGEGGTEPGGEAGSEGGEAAAVGGVSETVISVWWDISLA